MNEPSLGRPQIGSYETRMARIFDDESTNTVIVALDNSSISGPEDGLRDMSSTITRVNEDGANAVLGFYGMFLRHQDLIGTAGILNLTLSTAGPNHLNKVQVSEVEQAAELGLDAVSVHVNTTAPNEGDMLGILGRTVAECSKLGIPVLAHMYPRTIKDGKEYHYQDLKVEDPDSYAKLVRHAARIAVDLGADIVKVPYTGSTDSFRSVVESTYGQPVVVAGGSSANVPEFLYDIESAMEAGARGVAVGRNFFERRIEEEGDLVLLALHAMAHKGYGAENAAIRAELIYGGRISRQMEERGWSPDTESRERTYYPFPHLRLLQSEK